MFKKRIDILTVLLFLSALGLSTISAFYAVSGLMAIFAAAVVPIVIMGSMLEVSKLVVASWLYRNWIYTSLLLRTYFCIALTVLMLLTSMGIFGYLSKAHLDQAVPTGDVASQVAILDERIKTEKDNIESARKALAQLDAQVNETIARTTDDKGTERSIQVRRSQQKERSSLLSEIQKAQTKISQLNEEKAPISSQLRKVEAEVGPIKYIAALIYGDNPDQNILEKATRIVIMMIVFVFDPMAVLMLIAVNQSVNRKEVTHDNSNETSSKESSEETSSQESEGTKEDSTSSSSSSEGRIVYPDLRSNSIGEPGYTDYTDTGSGSTEVVLPEPSPVSEDIHRKVKANPHIENFPFSGYGKINTRDSE